MELTPPCRFEIIASLNPKSWANLEKRLQKTSTHGL
jgi:hypothetical protein